MLLLPPVWSPDVALSSGALLHKSPYSLFPTFRARFLTRSAASSASSQYPQHSLMLEVLFCCWNDLVGFVTGGGGSGGAPGMSSTPDSSCWSFFLSAAINHLCVIPSTTIDAFRRTVDLSTSSCTASSATSSFTAGSMSLCTVHLFCSSMAWPPGSESTWTSVQSPCSTPVFTRTWPYRSSFPLLIALLHLCAYHNSGSVSKSTTKHAL